MERDIPSSVSRARSETPDNTESTAGSAATSAQTSEAQSPAPTGDQAAPAPPPKPHKYFPYTIRPGDSLGTIAATFGITTEDLARVNRMHPDDELMSGATLRIPNPYEAQQKSLEAQVEQLSAQAHDSESKLDATKNQVLSLSEHNAELTAENATLKDTVKVMPWWRATSLGAGAAALLMLGVTILTLFEWWSLRRRFLALSGLAESLGHLDVKYKEMLAKAELRMQQLYGRRRPGMPDTSAPVAAKTAEEIEIERLNIRLRETLEHHLERLGAGPRSKGRARWREVIGADEPAEAPSRR